MEYLKQLRLSKKVPQQNVAKFLGISRQAYSNYENGNREPDMETLLKLAEYFEVTVDELLRGKEKAPTAGQGDERNAALTEGEEALLALFRRVSPDKQKLVIEMIRAALSTKE